MFKKSHKKTASSLIITLLISILVLSGCTDDGKDKKGSEETPKDIAVVVEGEDGKSDKTGETIEESALYLKEFYDISFEKELTKEDMNTALKKIFGEESPMVDGELNGLTFIKVINEASGFKELALTYSYEKAKESLEANEISEEIEEELSKYIAATIDAKLLNPSTIKELVPAETITHDMAVKSFGEIINDSTLGRNYLGYSDDEDIYRKIEDSWESFILFDDETLTNIGAKLVKEEKITGYNLKLNAYKPDFLSQVTMSYGHSNIDHGLQLIALLNSEDLVAKVQLEPKVSIYEYLTQWGEPSAPSAKYYVNDMGNILLANAMEYDLNLEFSSPEDLIKFDNIIDKYAKKNESNKGEGLIIESWWQPFLLVSNEKMPEDRFFEINDISLSNDDYTLRTVVLKEDRNEIESQLKKLSKDATIDVEDKYTNKAFYDYLQGINYQ